MKLLVVFLFLVSIQATAKESLVWIVAPEVLSAQTEEQGKGIKNLETYLSESLQETVKVEIQTASGFGINQLKNLTDKAASVKPDYIFYVQSSRMFAKDLEEVLLSKNMPLRDISKEFYSKDELAAFLPGWSKVLPSIDFFAPAKEAMILKKRMGMFLTPELSSSSPAEDYLRISTLGLVAIQYVLKDREKVVFFVSPERVRFAKEIFPNDGLSTSFGQLFFPGVTINKATLKDYLSSPGFNVQLLPGQYAELGNKEYLMKDAQWTLNSTGVQQWFQIIKPMISSYIIGEKKTNEVKAQADAKPPVQLSKKPLKKQKAKVSH